jgi:ech hydrogenase subunit D
MEQVIKQIAPNELLSETLRLKNYGYRLVAISCTSKNGLELTYSFDKELSFLNLRIMVAEETKIDSISVIYPYSFLYENEIKELFGVKIKGINVDFDNSLYRIAVKTPFNEKKEGK